MTESLIQLPTAGEPVIDTFDRMIRTGPIVPYELPGGVRAWMAVSHQAVSEVLAGDGTLFSKNTRNCPAMHDGTIPADWPLRVLTDADHLLNMDGNDHMRMRRAIARAFTPARVAQLEPRIQQLTNDLIDKFADQPEVDLVDSFTMPLPVAVICELFGVPTSDRPKFRGWTAALISHNSTGEQTQAAMQEMVGYLSGLVADKHSDPGDDLTSDLVRAQPEHGLADAELVEMLWIIIVAGHETTMHLLGNAVVALYTYPEQLAAARAGDRWAEVVEETLRYRNAACAMFNRYALRDVRIAGVDIPAGAIVGWYAGVGRDPQKYPDADVFDLDRDHSDQLGFGRGPHFCLGAHLARLESRIALATLFGRFPDLRLACDPTEIPYAPQFMTNGPLCVPVQLQPAD
ncbi:cytochrome P450 [Nocardia cyriacigeorgica]|uniref:Cytochrome P450 monooxygenase n=1 Tax=Nocardia cyriacigeorgica (strain GUH-2) TaxID=1127134 RepID=H6R8K9_NOCCG|nr:cytochrome P450 [Nocardia cyriacigeorgica]MBF6084879.1 cytochrome P450 [Nocardia cyriacigeorgica]BDU03955.1 cytochrome P450 hydroxylase [Nocardia cyriacigeorgica]CCF61037.1 Cytochrome P450 monooxygenase [Nocardia cyriacigeorgica GUH-2]